MPTLTIPRNYSDGNAFTEAHLDAALDAVEIATNTTKWGEDNLQALSVGTSQLQATSVTAAKLAADAVTTAKIVDANVTANKLVDSAVTTAKIADANVTLAKMASSSVGTSQLVDGCVTQTKRASLGQQVSASCGTYSMASTSLTDVTNLSVSITTTGRPVLLFLQTALAGTSSTSDGGTIEALNNSNSQAIGVLRFVRDSTAIGLYRFRTNSGSGTASTIKVPAASCMMIDVPAAGTYTYKVQVAGANVGNQSTVNVNECSLVAFEL